MSAQKKTQTKRKSTTNRKTGTARKSSSTRKKRLSQKTVSFTTVTLFSMKTIAFFSMRHGTDTYLFHIVK